MTPTKPRRFPAILLDAPDEGYSEATGWVELLGGLTQDEARDYLTEFCLDEDGYQGYRPTGEITRAWMRPCGEADFDLVLDLWDTCEEGEEGARLFWQVSVS